jgi:hypothetical protein
MGRRNSSIELDQTQSATQHEAGTLRPPTKQAARRVTGAVVGCHGSQVCGARPPYMSGQRAHSAFAGLRGPWSALIAA